MALVVQEEPFICFLSVDAGFKASVDFDDFHANEWLSREGNGAFSASEKITRVLNQHNIKVAHKPDRKVGSFLKRPKDQRKKEDTRGTVYKIECNDCAAVRYF